MFRLHPLFLAILTAQGMLFPARAAWPAELQPFSPEYNDNKAGVFCVCNGSTQTLSGIPQFATGLSGNQPVTLGELQREGRFIGGTQSLGAPRFNAAIQNDIITLPDPNGSGNNQYQVYRSSDLIGAETIDTYTQVNDGVNVGDAQYINARVAQVSNGTINVNIGNAAATTTASSNSWTMAAKQSELFTASGSGTLNWRSNNRIIFDAVSVTPGQLATLPVNNTYTLNGEFTVTTRDGVNNHFNVTNVFELQDYNDWLITQLQSGNLSSSQYNPALNKALTLTNSALTYAMSASALDDDVAQPVGDRGVLSADGAQAKVTVAAGKRLEVGNASGGAVRASNGGTAVINGKVSSTSATGTDSAALAMFSGGQGVNNGVINGNFFNEEDGHGIDRLSVGYGSNGVNVLGGSRFTNNGVINYAPVGNFSAQADEVGRSLAALSLGSSSAVNNGNINVGMWESTKGGHASAVAVYGRTGSFENAASGTIYLGRTVQETLADATSDTELNQSGGTRGIEVAANASAVNNGHIVIGTRTQNAVAMQASGGEQTRLQNNGLIDINGLVDYLAQPNIGMLVMDTGSNGLAGNSGTINVNSYNSSGLKVMSTAVGNSASAYSDGLINVSGRDYPTHYAPSYGVWVSGQNGGSATANLSGPITVDGVGAVGIRADGNATVNLTSAAIPQLSNGMTLTGLEIIGPDAQVNLPQDGRANLPAWYSTLIRLQQGASLDGAGVTFSADGGYSTLMTADSSGSTINTNGATFNLGYYDTGLQLNGGAQANIHGSTFNLNGEGALGATIAGGGTLTIDGGSIPVFNDINQTAYSASGASTQLVVKDTGPVDVRSAGSTLYRLDSGARLNPWTASDVTLSGDNSNGVVASGWQTFVYGTDRYTVSGEGATAVRITDGAEGILSSPITLTGKNSTGAVSAYNDTTIYASSQIGGDGAGATAFVIGDAARVDHQGQVDLTGSNATGARLTSSGNFINRGRVHIASGTGVDAVDGYDQFVPIDSELRVDDGTALLRVGSGAGLKIYGDGSSTLVAGGSADGLLLDSGASSFDANYLTLTVNGSGSGINNRAGTSNILLDGVQLDVIDGTGIRSGTSFDYDGRARINVSGHGTGYLFANPDGSTTANDLLIGPGYTINVAASGTGIRANTTGQVISAGDITIADVNGGSAIVTSTASQVINRGSILSYSTAAPVIDLRGGNTVFINEGSLTAPNPETVVVAGGATDDQIAMLGSDVTGEIKTGNGSDTLVVSGGALNGSLTMGSGENNQALVQQVDLSDTAHITTDGGLGSTLNLSGVSASGGSFASDDLSKGVNLGAGWSTINFDNTQWALTDNLKLAHSTISISANSTLYAGNGVNPELQGATGDSLVVNNAGTLDMTNGVGSPGNTLTIDGTLASTDGQLKLITLLNEGGALSNQHTDMLRVNGDVTGTTLITVTPTADSLGALTDLNRNGVADSNEGISLAQVSGSASASSFTLKGGYLTAGAYRYQLYSFAPGVSSADQRQVSGTGDQFWDYRLANVLLTQASAARVALAPQVPSYISAPLGLAYYTLAVTDDLHKRLGELRHQQTGTGGESGGMFLRYLGSNLRYHSNRGFSDNGFDSDLDFNAVQIGGNLLTLNGAEDSLSTGIAYTRGNARIRPHAVDGYSSTAFDSDSLALYTSWLRDSGFYLDGALSWSWHRGETDIARQKQVGTLKGQGWTASLESGYPLPLGGGVQLEPQAQLMYMRLDMDSFTDGDGTRVSYGNYDQTVARLGARLDRRWQDEGGRQYTPYLQVNVYRGWGGTAKSTVSDATGDLRQSFDGGKFGQMAEVGLGGSASLQHNVSLYAEADYRREIDGNGASGWRYNAGVRWTF